MTDKSIIIRNGTQAQQYKFDANERRKNKAQRNYERDQEGYFEPEDLRRRYYNRRGKYIKAINIVMKSKGKPPIDFKVYNDHELQIQYMYSCLDYESVKNSQLLFNFARHNYEYDEFYQLNRHEREAYYAGLRPLRPLVFVSKDENMFVNLYNEIENNWHYHNEMKMLYTLKERWLKEPFKSDRVGYKRFYPNLSDYTDRIILGWYKIEYDGDTDIDNPDYGKMHYVYKEYEHIEENEENEDNEENQDTEKTTTTILSETTFPNLPS